MTVLRRLAVPAAALLLGASAFPAAAQKIGNPVAVFTGLDKITGKIITFDAYIDETVKFGELRVTARVCYTRPETEAAQTDAFVEVDEITLDNQIKRIFTGWMFAASPALNAVEHPVYDVWLNDCRRESDLPPPDQRGGGVRDATPNPDRGPGEAPVEGVQIIDGVPIPRDRPATLPPIEGGTDPDLPSAEAPVDGPILD